MCIIHDNIHLFPVQYNRNIRQMRVPFQRNEWKCAGNCEAIRKKFICASAARVRRFCRASINSRAIKIKREASPFPPRPPHQCRSSVKHTSLTGR